MTNPDWSREIAICNKYLVMDERNFHCWDYRDHIVSRFIKLARILTIFSTQASFPKKSETSIVLVFSTNSTKRLAVFKVAV